MPLWIAWFDAVRALRPACRRLHTFLWMTLALIGLSCRPERAGVTSMVRLFGFGNKGYPCAVAADGHSSTAKR